jgi:hypothetical protein
VLCGELRVFLDSFLARTKVLASSNDPTELHLLPFWSSSGILVCLLSSQEKMMMSALLWGITQRGVVILYRRFGTTYRSRNAGKGFSLDAA